MHKRQATVPTYDARYLHLYTSSYCRCIHSVLTVSASTARDQHHDARGLPQ